MLKIFCDNCDKELYRNFYPYEIRRWKTHFCNRECQVDYHKKIGHYKRMSQAGKAGRSRVIPQSNREKPRRQKIVCYQL